MDVPTHVTCPYCSEPVVITDGKYQECQKCGFTFELTPDNTPIKTTTLFRYKNGKPIQFFKCNTCGDIITGCIHHHMEYCKCGESAIDQDDIIYRGTGLVTNVTEQLSYEEKRLIFTKTVFDSCSHDEEWIANELNRQHYINDIFSKQEFIRLYNLWKEGKYKPDFKFNTGKETL